MVITKEFTVMKNTIYKLICLLLIGSMTTTYVSAATALRTERFSVEQNELSKTVNGVVLDQHGKPLSLKKDLFPPELGKTFFYQ